VLPSLLRTLSREDPLELVEILDLRGGKHHRHYALPRGFSAPAFDADGTASLLLLLPRLCGDVGLDLSEVVEFLRQMLHEGLDYREQS
jgi:hypothetical protein